MSHNLAVELRRDGPCRLAKRETGGEIEMDLTQYITSLIQWLASRSPRFYYLTYVLMFSSSYFLVVLLVRWHILARFLRNRLQAEIDMVRASLRVEGWVEEEMHKSAKTTGNADQGSAYVGDEAVHSMTRGVSHFREDKRRLILNSAGDLIRKAERISKGWNLLEFFFWSRGQEVVGLSYVRKARRLSWALCSEDEVRGHLETLAQELEQSNKPAAVRLAAKTKRALIKTNITPNCLKVLLQEVSRARDEREISHFITMIGWHNKAMWMTTIALLLTTSLAFTVSSPNPKLFLAGAIGGFLSRMMRMLKSSTNTTAAEGEAWVTLFISPLVGALAGWTGVLLIIVTNAGMTIDVNGVQDAASKVLELSSSHYALGVAILLGFSERYFDRLISRLDESESKDKTLAEVGPIQEMVTVRRN